MKFGSLLPGLRIDNKREPEEIRIHLEDSQALPKLAEQLKDLLAASRKRNPPIIICIGTDRSTGDCLGPLTGWRLEPLVAASGVDVFGTLEKPVHAQNLEATLKALQNICQQRPVIAVDACLGRLSSVGTVLLKESPLQPGIGIGKCLPEVGDISISGIVNIGGFMDLQVLQSTRLYLVLRMSQLIAGGISLALKQTRLAPNP